MKPQTRRLLTFLALIAMLAVLLSVIVLTHFWQAPYFLLRHVNPASEVEQRPLPSFMVLLYLSTLDGIIRGDYKAVAEGLRALNSAYIPEGLRFIAIRFHSLLNTTWNLVSEIRSLLDEAETLISLGRSVDAKPLLREALIKYEQARSIYVELELALQELTRSLGLPAGELSKKIEELGRVIEELYSRLMRLLEIADLQQQLKDTFLVIDVEPKYVWTGGSIEVRGKLYAIDEGTLSSKLVKVYIDGVELAKVETREDGLFIVEIDLPYIYRPTVTVQARYVPQGVDSQLYKPTVSNEVVVRLLYIQPKIRFEVVGEALPGKLLTVNGRVESEAPLPYDRVTISWIGSSLTANLVEDSFSLKLRVPEDVAEGKYPLTVKASASGVYAPAQETVYVDIIRIPLEVKLQIPSIMMAGLPSILRGKVLYQGEAFDVSVKVVIFTQTCTATSSGEFSFEVVPPPTTLTGYQVCEVYVSPAIPWYREVHFKEEVLVINPLMLTFTLGLVAALAIRLSRGRGGIEQKLELPPEVEEVKPKILGREWFATSELEWLVDMYWQAVVIVTKLTGVDMKPSMTMREYMAIVSSKLGNLRSNFETLTLVAEKALYAREVAIEEVRLAEKAFEAIKLAWIET